MQLSWLACSIICAATFGIPAANFPDLVVPQGTGVNIHFTRGHERDLDLLAAGGFKFVRMDFSWGGTERRKGEYDWSAYDDLAAGLERRGLGAIFILDYSNDLYEKDASPQHPESVAAFARWAAAAARHFSGRHIIWEIWNEPNISFWKPKPDVQQYIALARATCQAVREVEPQATIVAPASSEFPWEFLDAMFRAGLLEQLDAVSVHPYRNYQRGPETAADDYLRLRAMIERYAPPAKRTMPILSGEWGYASHSKGVSLETQAAFLVRQQLSNLLNRIPVSIWYDWKNDGPNPDDAENNFGTVDTELRPKPAYEAVQVMMRELSGYRIAHRLDVRDPEAYVLLFHNAAGDQKLAAWSTASARTVSVEVGLSSAALVGLIDGKGQAQPVSLQAGQLQLSLSALPQYVSFRERSLPLTGAAAWQLDSPFPGSVHAGSKDGFTLQLSVRNPFPKAISAQATLAGTGLDARKTVKIEPGKAAKVKLAGGVVRRDLRRIAAILAVQMQDPGGKTLSRSAEPLTFELANPIRLVAAPAERALRLTVDEVTDDPFSGSIRAGKQQRAVALTTGASTASVEFPLPGPDSAAGPFDLLDKAERTVAHIPARKYQALAATNFSAKLDGDAKIAASASVHNVAAPGENPPFSRAFALDYQFDEGWRFVRCEAAPAVHFERRPAALGVWVFGDNSGNALRIRIRDSSGQTFQPSGPNLNWSGWRWVVFDLDHLENAGHWGGQNDGVARGELTLDTALLVDGSRHKDAGQICFAGFTAIY